MTGLEGIDEADIEEEIRRELDALDDREIKCESESQISDSSLGADKDLTKILDVVDPPLDSVETYIRLLQSRNANLEDVLSQAQDSLKECTSPVFKNQEKTRVDDQEIPKELKEKVLKEIDEFEINDKETNKYDADLSDEVSTLEEAALSSLKELERKQNFMSGRLESVFNEIKEEELSRKHREEAIREQNQKKADKEYQIKAEENKATRLKLKEEAESEHKKLKNLEKQLKIEIKLLEKKQKADMLALQRLKDEESKKQARKREAACVTIQKNYRRFRVMSEHGKLLETKRGERQKGRQEELEALERREKELMEEAIRKAKEEEEERLKQMELEKRRREEEERRRQEAELRKRQEIERKKKEEEEKEEKRRLEEKRIREEEERKKQEEEERKRLGKEEEKKRREEEERKKREEEERKRAEEEMRRKEEEARRNEEKKKAEEQRRKEEEENRRKEDIRKAEGKKKRMETEVEARKADNEIRRIDEEERRRQQKKNEEEGKGEEAATSFGLPSRSDGSVDVVQDFHEERQERLLYGHKYSREPEQRLGNQDASRNCPGDVFQDGATGGFVGESSDSFSEWERRQAEWFKRTVLWSSVSAEEDEATKSRQRARRSFSASQKLPSISEEEIAKSSKTFTSLENVCCVNLKDLPARNLKIILKCAKVQSVTVRNCGLLAAESLDNCKHLKELNLSNNCIKNISCQNMESLELLNLNNNQITSIHGLNGCKSLHSLALDGNKITRIGSFPCNKVMHLSLQNNQLITTKGLSQMRYLQTLDCSNNYLNHVEEIESCLLLRSLKLQGNNLQKPPSLSNHVLLREIHLGGNSISSLECLSTQWLPLLQHLFVSNNSISNVSSLRGLPLLETLDLKNNLISDEENLLPGVTGCYRLRTLRIGGNPVCEDSNIKTSILRTLPHLNTLDEESIGADPPNTENCEKTSIVALLHSQIVAQDRMLERDKVETSKFRNGSYEDDAKVIERLAIQSRHFKELQDFAIQQRLQHENHEVVVDLDHTTTKVENGRPDTTPYTTPETLSAPKEGDDLQQQERTVTVNQKDSDISTATWKTERIQSGIEDNTQPDAPRDVAVLKDKDISTNNATDISRPQPEESNVNVVSHLPDARNTQAATVIQAHFRGYRIRKRYAEATKAACYSGIDLGEDEFNFDEEVDLTMFDMDEAALDSSWAPGGSAQSLPRNSATFHSPPSQQKANALNEKATEKENDRPFPPRQAWHSPNSPLIQYNPRGVIPPIDATSRISDQTSQSGNTTQRSHRTSELSHEWGFAKDVTAELMLKRAKRMKYNALRKKKLNDPEKRFEIFKKTEKANKAREVRPVQKKGKPRIDYFSGRSTAEYQPSPKHASTRDAEEKAKEEMTFSWVYDQAVLHKDEGDYIIRETKGYLAESRPSKSRPERSPPVSLPRMDPVILAGRHLPLVASPVGNPRPSPINTGDLGSRTYPKHSWSSEKTHSNPDLTRSGLYKTTETREKSSSADARIMRERNNLF